MIDINDIEYPSAAGAYKIEAKYLDSELPYDFNSELLTEHEERLIQYVI